MWGRASPDRTAQRNGYRHRELDTRVGTLDVEIPKLRTGTYFPDWLLERPSPLVACNVTRYTLEVIVSFRHKGLERLYCDGSKKGVQADHVPKLLRIMSLLDVAQGPDDLAIPSFRTHQLKGGLAGHWSIWVNGNWRVTFRFVDSDVELVDYQDYH